MSIKVRVDVIKTSEVIEIEADDLMQQGIEDYMDAVFESLGEYVSLKIDWEVI